jgi:acyl-CoA synthetase (NDP forming)
LIRARNACRRKPVIVLKSGRTPIAEATLHTAAFGETVSTTRRFARQGIRASSLQEMVEISRVFTTQPPMAGKKIGVLTTSGSLGAMTADAAFLEGMELPRWQEDTLKRIRSRAPGWVNIKNPLDVGPSGIFPAACREIFADPGADGFILVPVIPFAAIEIYMRWSKGQRHARRLAGAEEQASGNPRLPCCSVTSGNEHIKELCGEAVATVHRRRRKSPLGLYRVYRA